MKKKEIKKLIIVICNAVAIAMGVSVIVLNILDKLEIRDSISMLALGLLCVGISKIIAKNK